ncbi:two-component system, response regulator YesN [Paenibacillus sp. UNC496MF]|uniref:response regulator transcription factor n=1 Tax=Paenibacillus sp. UNC496MF TaxID=1502753 RepID=UPI0008EFDAD4|nr:response regulator [Paenibacillus sp. UNC496MF]SFJ84340.1 two-component system, response regulator YesN [Paenibacillus sp. UNC496MF]
MYNAIIVDDEAVVRVGLKNTIDWREHGFALTGDYANGRDAWEAIEQRKPDLVISDISMPFMDGLELAGLIAANYPYIKVIILTGFDEFEYAQQALRLKVSDFVLKPITAREIRGLLDKVRAEMDEERERREDLSRLQSQLKQSLPILRERFLERLVAVGLGKAEIADRFAYFGLAPLAAGSVAVVADIDDFGDRELPSYEHDAEFLRFAAFDIFEEVAEREGAIAFRTREERMVAILAGEGDGSDLYETAFRYAEEVRYHIEKFLSFTATFGVGRVVPSAELLPASYKGALSALDYRFLHGKNRVLGILDLEGRPEGEPLANAAWDRKLVSTVKTGSVREAQTLIEDGIAELKRSRVPIETCFLQMQKVVLALMNAIQEVVAHDREASIDSQMMLMEVYAFKTLDEIEAWLKQVVGAVMTEIAENRNHFTNAQMHRAVEYIETNYADDKMSLQDLCRHVHMSTSYFSLVFKQHTGETFVEYLTGVRIAKAKELLQATGLKFYEIAARVGYGDPNYFSILFKKRAGMTPKEYRERLAKESGA